MLLHVTYIASYLCRLLTFLTDDLETRRVLDAYHQGLLTYDLHKGLLHNYTTTHPHTYIHTHPHTFIHTHPPFTWS